MMLTRLGSLNALEQTQDGHRWHRLLGGALPSADTIARVFSTLDLDPLRRINREVYARLKRRKALRPPAHGLMALILDGHESHATYDRQCPGCLAREITCQGAEGDKRTQFYHRHVAAFLVARDLKLLLDLEPIRPGEDEIAAALRLLDRVVKDYPRAFDVVLGDALYARSDFFNAVLAHGKDALAVLKHEARDLMGDVRSLLDKVASKERNSAKRQVRAWDMEGFRSWPQVKMPVRVVRTLETTRVKRQRTGEIEEHTSEWMWVTTLSQHRASTWAVVDLGHGRWGIENEGFNETVNRWHGDHVYTHDDHAMLAFALLLYIAYNLFVAFWRFNLKSARRHLFTMMHIAAEMAAALRCQGLPSLPQARAPT